MSYLKSIVKNALSNWANLLITLIISFFLAPFILKKIGNDFYGIWVLITQTTGYLWLLDFGVRESVIKYVAEYSEKKEFQSLNNILASSIRIYSIVCIVCVLTSCALSILFPYLFKISPNSILVARLVVIITGIDIAQAFFFNVFTGILMGLQRYDIFSKVNIGFSLVRAFLTVLFLNNGHGIVALAVIQLTMNFGTNLIVFVIAKKSLPIKLRMTRHLSEGRTTRKMILSYSLFVLINNLCVQAIFYSSNIIIAVFMPIANVTFFAIAGNLIEYMKKLIFTGTQVFAPLTSQLDAKQDPDTISNLLIIGTKFTLFLGLPVASVYIILGGHFIKLWMGHEYSEISGMILSILAATTIFSIPHYTVQGILLGLNRHNILAYCRIVEAICNVFLSILLINKFGLIGVAVGSAIPHLIMVIIVLPLIITRITHIKIFEYFKKSYTYPFISIIPFATLCYFTKDIIVPKTLLAFFAKVLVLVIIYICSVWAVGINKEEKAYLNNKLAYMVLSRWKRQSVNN